MYDYLIVGCGLFGATFAREMLDAGRSVLMIDQRSHIGGNCYTEEREGINVHVYGPHQLHTKSRRIWDWLSRFAEFNHYRAHIKVNYKDRLYSFPPNMMLYHQLWGVRTPEEARAKVAEVAEPIARPSNLEEFVLSSVGRQVYEMFYEGYSTKQWGRHPREIPMSVGRRLPIRFNWTDRWFEDEYEGIPKGGYTRMIENIIDGADVSLGVDYLDNKKDLDRSAKRVVYTGKIDQLFGYRHGELEYRSLRFEHETLDREDFQGNAIVNYTDIDVPFTRITEHKHFEFGRGPKTIITREYPQDYDRTKIPYYPVDNARTRETHAKYAAMAKEANVIGGGRLFEFKYFNMDQVVGSAMKLASTEVAR